MSVESQSQLLFQEEARELLSDLDSSLLELEREPENAETVNHVFRIVHTLKGDCDMFGLAGLVSLLHDMETIYDQVRTGAKPVTKPLLDLTFAVKDRVGSLLESGQSELSSASDMALMDALVELLDQNTVQASAPPATAVSMTTGAQSGAPESAAQTFRVRLTPSDPGHLGKLDPATLLDALRALGKANIVADSSAVPGLEALDPADCHLRWDIILTTDQGENAIRDIFLFLDKPSDVLVEFVDDIDCLEDIGTCKMLGEILVERGDITPAQRDQALTRPGKLGEKLAASGVVSKAAVRSALAEQEAVREKAQIKTASKEPAQSLRVEAAKLDNLVNLVGELVIAQARLTQISSEAVHLELTAVAEEIERLVGELRDNTLNIRMLPIGTTFSRFRRLVRDLSSELHKEIELMAEGGETELDKTVIEQLGDPLVHLLRNSIDHGVESPEERQAAGKSRKGTIVLSAKQAGGSVIIRITDDGRGLNLERIREKAIERGIIAQDARLPAQEMAQLIFAPGFSTAEKVTNVSGRGVGMDVVKRSIEALRGKVEIENRPGHGAAVTIVLPLTMAIIDGLQVRSGDEFFIIPLAMVEECVEITEAQRESAGTSRTISLRGEIVPFLRLRETFVMKGQPPHVEQVVITRHENGRTGIAVDQVIGQQQTVIKNLGRFIGQVEGISGATINGDGSMALILDVPQLVQSVQQASDQKWDG